MGPDSSEGPGTGNLEAGGVSDTPVVEKGRPWSRKHCFRPCQGNETASATSRALSSPPTPVETLKDSEGCKTAIPSVTSL